MRLFCGLDLAPDVTRALGELVGQLRPAARINWIPVENLHLTTKFIGEWPAGRIEEITRALTPLGTRAPFRIEIRGLGWFPNPHSPRIFWAGVKAPPDLAELARATDAALGNIGVPPEARPFSPHLTLARIKSPVPLSDMLGRIAGLESTDFGSFAAGAFYLYRSERGPGGSVYTKLAEFPLNQP
ncbi:MAG: RNA 2',3'-cyclic phosphodiesterase [Acidobacteriota bacterium]